MSPYRWQCVTYSPLEERIRTLLVKRRRELQDALPRAKGRVAGTSQPHLSPVPAGQTSTELLGKSLNCSTRYCS